MTTWKHRDSELDRTCGKPVPLVEETIFGKVSEPFCAACDGEVYRTVPLASLALAPRDEHGEVIGEGW